MPLPEWEGTIVAQPAPWNEARAGAIIQQFIGTKGPMLPILHALQAEFGCVPEAAKPLVAKALNLSRAEVHGIVTFYHDFRAEPAGRRVLKLCRAEACQATGGEGVAKRLLDRLGISWGETTADGALTVEAVYCLGLCATAPAGLVDGKVVGRLSDARLAEVLA